MKNELNIHLEFGFFTNDLKFKVLNSLWEFEYNYGNNRWKFINEAELLRIGVEKLGDVLATCKFVLNKRSYEGKKNSITKEEF